jgi:dipeptidyl aminopeptidase/acylaminoacyl peptidase
MRLAKLTTAALAFGLVGGVVGFVLLTSAIYTHRLTHPGCGEMGATPADVGLENAQDVTYLSHDGGDPTGRGDSASRMTLRAWYLPPQNGAVIVLLPGLGGARDGMLREGAILARHGYGLLMTELRSCAHPEGQTTLGYYEAEDLKEAVTWVLDQSDVDHVGVLGYSLGGVTAILGAAQDERIEAVVAEGGFYDLAADITNQGGHNPVWKAFTYQAILFFFQQETGIDARDVSPISAIGRISPRPLLLIYGERELAETHARELLARAGEPKDLWIVPSCWHGGYLDVAPEEWENRVAAFFDAAFLPPIEIEK